MKLAGGRLGFRSIPGKGGSPHIAKAVSDNYLLSV